MKKIRYLIIIIPVLVIMLFSQPNVSAVELGMNVNDIYETINGADNWQDIIIPKQDRTLTDVLQDSFSEGQLFILNNNIAIIDNITNDIIYDKYVMYLYFDVGAGDGILVMDGELFPLSLEDLYQYYGNEWSIIFTRRKDENTYGVGYRQGRIEVEKYYENLIPNLLEEEFLKGYNDGYLAASYDNIDDLPTWVINSDIQLNEELYNYIDYDNLVFYENVGQDTFDGSENWVLGYQGSTTNVYKLMINLNAFSLYNNLNAKSNLFNIVDVYNTINIGMQPRFDGYHVKLNNNDFPNVDTFKQYLSQNPLTVTYELAEKQEIPILQEDINQLPFYEYGISQGYINGYQKGQADSKAIQGFIPTIIGAIWVVIANFMAFEIFGLSLWWILGIVVSISLAIFLLKLVMRN